MVTLRNVVPDVKLNELTRAMLEEAVRLYLAEAYAGASPPLEVRARLEWPATDSFEALLAAPRFERTPADVPLAECQHIRLRLGNRAYPHMKLGLDRVPETEDWVLVADSHDLQLMAVVQEHERAALETLLQRNADLKTRIERRWMEAGLPTFERFIRGRLAGR